MTVTARDARARGTDLLVALRDAGIGVVGFDVRAPTLDDVFLAVTGEPDGNASGTETEREPTDGVRSGPVGAGGRDSSGRSTSGTDERTGSGVDR